MTHVIHDTADGVRVYQVTDTPVLKDNIYCERSYGTPDGRAFVFQQQVAGAGSQNPTEFIACDFGTWQTRVLGRGYNYPEISAVGRLYYTRGDRHGRQELVRVDIQTGQSDPIPVRGGVRPRNGMTISADERYLAYGFPLGYDPQRFGVERVDLERGEREIVFEDPFIWNPHPQFDPGDTGRLLIQQNRGCRFSATGEMLVSQGEEGVTLLVVQTSSGKAETLRIGPPREWAISGHEQWIAATGEVLFTATGKAYARPEARQYNLRTIRPGEQTRTVPTDWDYNHVNVSVCGRLYCCDTVPLNPNTDPFKAHIMIGSIRSGKAVQAVADWPTPQDAHSRFGQSSHLHPYLSPDLRWIVFNAMRDGRPQICVASIPDAMHSGLAALDRV